jgi:hypothetical protein
MSTAWRNPRCAQDVTWAYSINSNVTFRCDLGTFNQFSCEFKDDFGAQCAFSHDSFEICTISTHLQKYSYKNIFQNNNDTAIDELLSLAFPLNPSQYNEKFMMH